MNIEQIRRRAARAGFGERSACAEDRAALLELHDKIQEQIVGLVASFHAGNGHKGSHERCRRAICAPFMALLKTSDEKRATEGP